MKAVTVTVFMFVLWAFSAGQPEILTSNFLDNCLTVVLPQYTRRLEDYALESFNLKVKKTGLTNRDLKAEFHDGKMSGLSAPPGLRRVGDCGPVRQGLDTILGCYISLEGLKMSYSGSARGENLAGTNRSVDVEATLVQSKGFIELLRKPGSPPTLKSWTVLPLSFRLSFSRSLDLNSERKHGFEEQVKSNIEVASISVLYGPLREALVTAIDKTRLQSL
ncbi:uncharacterized protein LOC135387615 [Ornithodoros turicata]|uniref:uncharacterized protein LOC135387615 n=1 Tax=Ornithodoros turicata TaxID=34597 RepID=UPI003139C447